MRSATAIGLLAILLWAALALLTAETGATPPFLLTAGSRRKSAPLEA